MDSALGGRGGVRGGVERFFADGVQKLRLHANKHRVSQCHANINSPWQFLCMFDTVPACHFASPLSRWPEVWFRLLLFFLVSVEHEVLKFRSKRHLKSFSNASL